MSSQMARNWQTAWHLPPLDTGYSFYLDSDFTKVAAISVGEIICESWWDLVNVDLGQFFVQIDGILSKTLKYHQLLEHTK